MITSSTRVAIAILAALATSFSSAAVATGQHVLDCVRPARLVLGEAFRSDLRLFEVTQDYALQIEFDKNCKVMRLDVSPKYAWEAAIPSWKEPDHSVGLSQQQYRDVMRRVSQIRRLGTLVSKGVDLAVTNSKVWPLDQYQRAFVQRVVYCCAAGSSEEVFSFSILYIHRVEGKVEDLKQFPLANGSKRMKVEIDGLWYLISAKELKKVTIGRTSALNVAGPVK